MNSETSDPIPAELQMVVAPVERALRRLRYGHLKQPQTFLDSLRRSIEEEFLRALESVPEAQRPQLLLSLLETALSKVSLEEVRAFFDEAKIETLAKLRSIKAGRSLARLYEEGGKATPGSPIALLAAFDWDAHQRNRLEPADLLLEVTRSRGERRARAAIRALHHVAEFLYDPYLRQLWLISGALKGKKRAAASQTFGALVKSLSQELAAYPGLVEAHTGLLRNSAAHGRWRYLPDERVVLMWDLKHPEPLRIPARELVSIVQRMYGLADGGMRHLWNYWAMVAHERLVLSQLAASSLAILKEPDPQVQAEMVAALEAKTQGDLAGLLGPLSALPPA